MARGVPVACSDRASLPEVAGAAAIQFDPEDQQAIAAAIERLLSDGELRSRLAAGGPGASRHLHLGTNRGAHGRELRPDTAPRPVASSLAPHARRPPSGDGCEGDPARPQLPRALAHVARPAELSRERRRATSSDAARIRTRARSALREGIVAPTLFSGDDMWTVNEVFCRQDYGNERGARTVRGHRLQHRHQRALLPDPQSELQGLALRAGAGERRAAARQPERPGGALVADTRRPSRGRRAGPSSASSAAVATAGSASRPRATIEVECVAVNDVLEERARGGGGRRRSQDRYRGHRARDPASHSARAAPPCAHRLPRAGRRPDRAPDSFDSSFRNDTWVLRNRAARSARPRPARRA